jgi:predicted esterase
LVPCHTVAGRTPDGSSRTRFLARSKRGSGSVRSPPRQVFDRARRIPVISPEPSADDGPGGLVTRRRFLLGVGLLGGGLYVARSLDGDFGGYDAPATQPMVSTRGRLDTADPTERSGSWEFDGAGAVVLFVHGLGADAESARDQAYTARLGLAAATGAAAESDALPVIGYSWASDADWGPAKRAADANAAPLADWLAAWADEDGRPVHLFAHSLGARVTGAALRELADRGHTGTLASVSLFGGAVPDESVAAEGRYGPAVAATDAPVFNFHSRNDRVLGWAYRAADRTRAVGHGGLPASATAPDGYADVDITDAVADHYSYVEPGEGCLPLAVERIGIG